MSRNTERVLSKEMIAAIQVRMFNDMSAPQERTIIVTTLMNAYLMNDAEGLLNTVADIIEDYENDILLDLNMELMEDSFKEADND